MLQDKDRIFKNLYGLHSWRLKAARARGAWDDTEAIIEKGHGAPLPLRSTDAARLEGVPAFVARHGGHRSGGLATLAARSLRGEPA